MKSKLLFLCAFLISISILLPSCKNNDSDKAVAAPEIIVPVAEVEPGIDEATWDLYPNEPLMSFINNHTENEKAKLSEEWDSAETICELTQEWTQTPDYIFDGQLKTRNHIPYTLVIVSDAKKTTEETEKSQSIREYIFLEYNTENNSFSAKGAFSKTIRKNGFYETVENTVMSKECTENRFIERLSGLGAESLPALHELTDDTQPQTAVRRYNHKPVNAEEMCLSAFPNTTIIEILSRFDDAYGELFGTSDEEYSLVSFDCYVEYDWLASGHLNEFTDGTDNTQPYTYSAVYNVKDADGISLVARLDLFAEIEPNKQKLHFIESVFSINYAGELIFEDIRNLEETVLLLDTIVMYHPEDVIVTPTTEQVEEQIEAEEAAAQEEPAEDQEAIEDAESEESDTAEETENQ